jgi:hypothetical protein
MSTRIIKLVLCAGIVALSACARAPEPEPVTIVPSFDKMGNAVCPAGTMVATEAETGAQVCVETMAG